MKGAAVVVGGIASVGLLALMLASGGDRVRRVRWRWTVTQVADAIQHTVRAESGGRFDAMNVNADGAGLSFGLIQWAQSPGGLGELLAAMYRRDPQRFLSTFGPASAELLRVTSARTAAARLAPVEGVVLWAEPWLARFRKAGADPVFQAVQTDLIVNGPYMTAAHDAAEVMGTGSVRALALLFDTAVNQGVARVRTTAHQVARDGGSLDEAQRLARFAELVAARFRRTSGPGSDPSRWRQGEDGAWYYWRGRFNIWRGVTSRTSRILRDPTLSTSAPLVAGDGAA